MSMSLEIRQLSSSELSPVLRGALLHLCDAAYRESIAPYLEHIGPGQHLFGYRHGRLVTHLMWVDRWLQPGSHAPLRTAYVELVATLQGEQRLGYATALLTALPPRLAEYQLAALSPATKGLYRCSGWILWRGPLFTRYQGTVQPDPEEEVMILKLPRSPSLDRHAPLSVEWRPGEVW